MRRTPYSSSDAKHVRVRVAAYILCQLRRDGLCVLIGCCRSYDRRHLIHSITINIMLNVSGQINMACAMCAARVCVHGFSKHTNFGCCSWVGAMLGSHVHELVGRCSETRICLCFFAHITGRWHDSGSNMPRWDFRAHGCRYQLTANSSVNLWKQAIYVVHLIFAEFQMTTCSSSTWVLRIPVATTAFA